MYLFICTVSVNFNFIMVLFQNIPISAKGRTGWPQDVWASELIPEHN